MKNLICAAILLLTVSLSVSSCKEDPDINNPKSINIVSDFVYRGMDTYYLWADEITGKKPTVNDTDPKKYFQSLLNSTDKKQGWSFITDDVQSLLADFSGEPKAFGFSVMFAAVSETEYIAFIQYVFPDTPASKAGLQRLDIIGKINGQPITEKNYMALFGTVAAEFTLYKISNKQLEEYKTVKITPTTIFTDPVLYTNTYEKNGKKIGYLFYTDFIGNFNNSLYEAFAQFKDAGVTDLVLDLRYNHGGAVSSAVYLASLIAPKAEVEKKSPFTTISYNSLLNASFDKKSRTDNLGDYDSRKEQNPLDANLNLNEVYIIATGDSYSASELLTFCLKPYMNVVHIGGDTGGKYTVSITIHPYDDNIGAPIYEETSLSSNSKTILRNWAMQPIIGKHTNSKGEDFSADGCLRPDYELREGVDYLVPLGDENDVFLGKALSLITGDESYNPAQKAHRAGINKTIFVPLNNPKDVRKEATILDNVKFPVEELRRIHSDGQ